VRRRADAARDGVLQCDEVGAQQVGLRLVVLVEAQRAGDVGGEPRAAPELGVTVHGDTDRGAHVDDRFVAVGPSSRPAARPTGARTRRASARRRRTARGSEGGHEGGHATKRHGGGMAARRIGPRRGRPSPPNGRTRRLDTVAVVALRRERSWNLSGVAQMPADAP
jgi:hypothetical protein